MPSLPGSSPSLTEKWQENIESRLFSRTHLVIPVGELVFHVFNVSYNEKKPGWSFSADRHGHHELIFTVEGEGTYEMNGQRYLVRKGDFFFIPRNVLHNGWAHSSERVWKSLVIELDFSLAHEPELYLDDIAVFPAVLPFYKHFILEREAILHVPPELEPQIGLIIERLTLEMAEQGPDYDLILQSSMIQYLVLISRAARQALSVTPLRQYAGRAKRLFRLETARQYLQQNYQQELTNDDIASQAHLSPFHFARLFKEAFGIAPHQYQLQLRIEEAKRLLVMTDMPIAQIAERLGYSSPEYFSRVFSSKVGVPPRSFSAHLASTDD